MTRQARVGLFTILGLIAVFAVFYVLADYGTRTRGYKIGVHFNSASGLHSAALVYLSGVPIGAVDEVMLQPDYTTDIILAIKQDYEIPKGSKFLIQAPLTGEPTILIQPPRGATADVETLPHEVLPIAEQPRGTNPASLSDLLEQGQGEVRRLDTILAQVETAAPGLLRELQSTLKNANSLSITANASLQSLSASAQSLSAQLSSSLGTASRNVVELTGTLDATVKNDSGKVDALLAQLNETSKSFGQTIDALRSVSSDPRLKNDILDTTRSFAVTAKTFAELTSDMRQVTGNPQTQAQLRDTVAQLDATAQKIDSLIGSVGGKSSVYGVDAGATPAPGGVTPPPAGYVPTSKPVVPSGAASAVPGSQLPAPAPRPSASVSPGALAKLRERLNRFTKDLVELQVRVSQLSPQRAGSANGNTSPLLTADRGPQSDFNVTILPKASTGLFAGVNDVGSSGTSTANFMLVNRAGNFRYGGGIEYSRLGGFASVAARSFGLEGRFYDLRHPTLDAYLNFFAAPKLQFFGGERDLNHNSRRTVLGLQFEL